MRVGQARKRDATEAGIVQALEACGAQVLRLGVKDAPDLLVRAKQAKACVVCDCPARSRLMLLEVKSAKGRIKPGQTDFHRLWPETIIVRTVEEALTAIGVDLEGDNRR